MAFSVSYSGKGWALERWHRSADKGKSPYDDWIRIGCPTAAAFRYTEHHGDDVAVYVYLPCKGLLSISLRFEYTDLFSEMHVVIDSYKKRIRTKAISCTSLDHWPEMHYSRCPVGEGGGQLLRKAIEFYSEVKVLETIAEEFFGLDWKFARLPKRVPRVRQDDRDYLHGKVDMLDYNRGPWTKTTAYFYPELDTAATKIQAAFKGWKVRMQYRYNPYNRLGQHVIMKAFENRL